MVAPYQAFPTADGQAMIGAGSDALFRRLADALGTPELGDDRRFADNPARVRNRQALVAAIAARTRQLETADVLERLRTAGVPAAPILTVDRVLEEPQTAASGMIVAAPHPRLPDYRSIGLPIRWDRQRPGVRSVPPLVGEHSIDVLTWLGYTLDEVRNLQAQSVVA
jgi:crotonobetainyl-CoA:carnitine CoA-transferase CaiB-like acyl-CoA transferase